MRAQARWRYRAIADWAIGKKRAENLFFDLRVMRVHSTLWLHVFSLYSSVAFVSFTCILSKASERCNSTRWSMTHWLTNCFALLFPGTKIVYERTFLLNLRNSPLSRTPPKNIPCHLMKGDKAAIHHHNHQNQMNGSYHPPQHNNKPNGIVQKEKDKSNGWSKVRRSPEAEEHQFDMDI